MSDKPKTFEDWQAKQFHTGGDDAEIHAERAWDFRDALAKDEISAAVEATRQEMQAEIDKLSNFKKEIIRMYKIKDIVPTYHYAENFLKMHLKEELNQGSKDENM